MLYRLKYRNAPSAIEEIGAVVEKFIRSWRIKFDVIVPAPPTRTRRVQPLHQIVDELSRRFNVPVVKAVPKKATGAAELKDFREFHEREAVLKGALTVNARAIAGKRVLFVDDLIRSGATSVRLLPRLPTRGRLSSLHSLSPRRGVYEEGLPLRFSTNLPASGRRRMIPRPMRRILLLSIAILVFRCAAPAPPPPAPLPEPTRTEPAPAPPPVVEEPVIGTVRVTASALNVRSEASTEAEIVTQVKKGESLSVLREDESWVKVRLAGGETGWVAARFVSRGNGVAPKKTKKGGCPPDSDYAFLETPRLSFSEGGAHGTVVVEAKVNAQGTVTSTKILSNATGDETLAFLAEREIKGAKFSPPIRGCVARAFVFTYRRAF